MKHFEIDGISFWFDKEENKYAMDMSKKRVEIVSMKNFGRLPKTHWEEDSVRHYISIRVTGYLLNDTWRKENGLPTLHKKTTIRQRIESVKRFLFRRRKQKYKKEKYVEKYTKCDKCGYFEECKENLIECTIGLDTYRHYIPVMGHVCKVDMPKPMTKQQFIQLYKQMPNKTNIRVGELLEKAIIDGIVEDNNNENINTRNSAKNG